MSRNSIEMKTIKKRENFKILISKVRGYIDSLKNE